jgi:dihydrofolate reductase
MSIRVAGVRVGNEKTPLPERNAAMRKLTVINHMTLDGVMQAPGRPDEDTRGGFSRGGWAQAGNDEVMASFMAAGRGGDPVALVLGRRTYLDFAGFWPRQPDNPYTEALTKQQKYVASRTLAEPLPWENSTLLRGDAAAAVAALKQEPGPDLLVLGSGELIQSLRQRALVDEYVLMIHPLILGPGRRLFSEGTPADLRLAETVSTTTGVIIARYQAR